MEKDHNPPRHVKDILGEMKFVPDCPAPEARKQSCALCHLDFLSRPQWFGTKWHYPNICVYCGDNYSHNEQIRSGGLVTVSGKQLAPRTELDTPLGVKKFYCPKCRIHHSVTPVKEGAYWAYHGSCKCGAKWVNLYHAYKRKEAEEPETTTYDPD